MNKQKVLHYLTLLKMNCFFHFYQKAKFIKFYHILWFWNSSNRLMGTSFNKIFILVHTWQNFGASFGAQRGTLGCGPETGAVMGTSPKPSGKGLLRPESGLQLLTSTFYILSQNFVSFFQRQWNSTHCIMLRISDYNGCEILGDHQSRWILYFFL